MSEPTTAEIVAAQDWRPMSGLDPQRAAQLLLDTHGYQEAQRRADDAATWVDGLGPQTYWRRVATVIRYGGLTAARSQR